MTPRPDALPPEAHATASHTLFKTLGKLLFITLAFVFAFTQVPLAELTQTLSSLPWWGILASAGCLLFAQWASAMRMRSYAASRRLPLSIRHASALYFAGMFYNTMLPGGIGGDGYKIYTLHRWYDYPVSESIRLMLAERASGLCVLLLLFYPIFYSSRFAHLLPLAGFWLGVAALATILGYWLLTPHVTRESRSASLHAGFWSLWVQGGTLASALVLWHFMPLEGGWLDYASLFLLSCIAAVLPLTIGGLGMRELIFISAAPYAADSQAAMLAFAIACSALYLGVALVAGLALLWLPATQPDAHSSQT